MPFATCWCVFRLPLDVRRQVETVFRTAMTARYAHLTDEVMWTRGLDAAAAAWAVHATVALLSRAPQDDLPMHASRRPVPSARQLLRYRWEGLAAQASFPALAELGRRLLATTAWQVPDLPMYPAWS
jgi:hypothetical protein